MTHPNLRIGLLFYTATGPWRFTDVGTRAITAMKRDRPEDPSWTNGPPYAVSVFDEEDQDGCALREDDV